MGPSLPMPMPSRRDADAAEASSCGCGMIGLGGDASQTLSPRSPSTDRRLAVAGPRASLAKIQLRFSLWTWPLVACVLASLNYALQHRAGIEVNADGWAYWQGAQSIADGLGYRYFSGDPIVAWPPLYSLYLSAWIKLCGSEAFVLILANCVLIVTQGIAWTYLCACLLRECFEPVVLKYGALYIALTVPLYEKSVLAHNLFYFILPIFIVAGWRAIICSSQFCRRYVLLASVVGVVLVESHISGLVYIAAAAAFFLVFREGPLWPRAGGAFALLAVPSLALILTAWGLGEIGGHPIERGRFSFAHTLSQVLTGIGDFVLLRPGQAIGGTCAIAMFGILLQQSVERKFDRIGFVFLFTVGSLSLLAVAFSITWLNGVVSEPRHLLIVPLLVIPIIVSYFMSTKQLVMKTAAFLIFLAPVSKTLELDYSGAADHMVPIHASISQLPGVGKSLSINGKTLIGPTRWEEPEGGYSSSGAPRWGPLQRGGVRPR